MVKEDCKFFTEPPSFLLRPDPLLGTFLHGRHFAWTAFVDQCAWQRYAWFQWHSPQHLRRSLSTEVPWCAEKTSSSSSRKNYLLKPANMLMNLDILTSWMSNLPVTPPKKPGSTTPHRNVSFHEEPRDKGTVIARYKVPCTQENC